MTRIELELELHTNEQDEVKVLQNAMELVKKAKELGFSIKELEIEKEDDDDETEV